MRRREAGRGAAPAGRYRSIGTRAAPGLRPCPLRDPARSWLTTEAGLTDLRENRKARPGGFAQKSPRNEHALEGPCVVHFLMRYRFAADAHVARRKAPAVSGNGYGHYRFCAFRRATPSDEVRSGDRRVGKGANAPCPPTEARWARFALPTLRSNPGCVTHRGDAFACAGMAREESLVATGETCNNRSHAKPLERYQGA